MLNISNSFGAKYRTLISSIVLGCGQPLLNTGLEQPCTVNLGRVQLGAQMLVPVGPSDTGFM